MADIDAVVLAESLSKRFSVAFWGGQEDVDGGRFAVVRPSDLERGNGFSIVVGRTPRRVEASLRMDRFAGALLRQMAEADEDARNLFLSMLEEAGNNGITATAVLNDVGIRAATDFQRPEWSHLEIDCDKRIPGPIAPGKPVDELVFEVAAACTGLALSLLPLEDARESPPLFEDGLPEGAMMRVAVNRYERSRMNRATCVTHHGVSCSVCGFNFARVYGKLGEGVIEVHHKIPVSQMGGAYRINPVTDLAPVCPNCHTMLHRQDPPLSIEALRQLLEDAAQQQHD